MHELSFDVDRLLREILRSYELPWHGLHGVLHWGRVFDNGMRVAADVGANHDVVALFALFHDAQRVNEGTDPGHGRRGAWLASELRGRFFDVNDGDFELLVEACSYHTDGLTDADVTVQACWDADRLDLGRVGIRPDPTLLCTPTAKLRDVIDWAVVRSRDDVISEAVAAVWAEYQGE